MPAPVFFGPLKRRAKYSLKANGSFYSYSYYREKFQFEIAEDCLERCVYCDCHEVEMGGREAMQLDHFRPYTRAGFENLENDPSNFHHACARCNLLKSDWWPAIDKNATHDGAAGFIDPFVELRSEYFEVTNDGTLQPRKHPAKYIVRLLALNRPHLKRLRERRILQAKLRELIDREQPRLEAAARGEGEMTREEALGVALQLTQLCKLYL